MEPGPLYTIKDMIEREMVRCSEATLRDVIRSLGYRRGRGPLQFDAMQVREIQEAVKCRVIAPRRRVRRTGAPGGRVSEPASVTALRLFGSPSPKKSKRKSKG